MIQMYGIKNCDTIKKAKTWLEQQQLPYQFHDYRVQGIDQALLLQFCQQLNWQDLINTRGTTWRGLSGEQQAVTDQATAIALMLEFPALIKRPLLQFHQQFYLGFKPAQYQQIFSTKSPI